MSCLRLQGVLVALCLLLGSRPGLAADTGTNSALANPAANDSTGLGGPATPSIMALPANTTPLAGDANSTRKFYTLTAELREIYDDNVTTASTNPKSSLETDLSPSILVDFPSPDGDFSARYTMGLTYYTVGPDTAVNNKESSETTITHDFVAQFSHSFTDRFNLAMAEEFRSYTEPSLDQSTGTSYQNGPYITNVVNGTFSAQWTPLLGTTTTYSNTIVRYDNADVAMVQNSIENTGSQVVSFAVFPKITLSFGGILDDLTYDDVSRGYTSYTGFVGSLWQALPSLSLSGRIGASYTEGSQGQAQATPYAALSLNWNLGEHSSLNFSYAHEVTPSDVVGADGETSDRFTAGFNYNITARLSAHLSGILTHSVIEQDQLVVQNFAIAVVPVGYTENTYEVDSGLTYNYNQYLDFDGGVTISGVTSEVSGFGYSRDQVYLGVRGTY